MTNQQILEKVNGLAEGNDIVEVYIWDKNSFSLTLVDAEGLQHSLKKLSPTEEVLGAIYYSGLDAPGREDFTSNLQGLKQFQILFDTAVEKQEQLRQEHGK